MCVCVCVCEMAGLWGSVNKGERDEPAEMILCMRLCGSGGAGDQPTKIILFVGFCKNVR